MTQIFARPYVILEISNLSYPRSVLGDGRKLVSTNPLYYSTAWIHPYFHAQIPMAMLQADGFQKTKTWSKESDHVQTMGQGGSTSLPVLGSKEDNLLDMISRHARTVRRLCMRDL